MMPVGAPRRPRNARPIRPGLEVLDRRDLPASLGPAVVLDSVTTLDSRSVTIEYDVASPQGLDQGWELGLYRSADDRFDPSDPTVAVLTVGGAATPAVDEAGNSVLAAGRHRLTIPLPEGLPPNPQHPYVLAVADPTSAAGANIEMGSGGAVAGFRKYVVGVVTHGGFQSRSDKWGSPWALQMAKSLRNLGYDAVIPYNWVAESRTAGAAAKQGPRVARLVELEAARAPAGTPIDVHFIGHSEGTVVNSVALRVLDLDEPPALAAGYTKATLLDPHAANNNAPGGRQYSVSSGLLGTMARWIIDDYQRRAKDPLPVIWDNVDGAEVFYQRNPISAAKGSNDGIYNLWGQVPVPSRTDAPVRYYNLTGVGISHNGDVGVVDWYQVHVVPTLGDDSSFVDPTLLNGGPSTGLTTPQGRRPAFQGEAAPGALVRLRAATRASTRPIVLGGTVADASGDWGVVSRPLPDGVYRVRARGVAVADPTWPRVLVVPSARLGVITVDAS